MEMTSFVKRCLKNKGGVRINSHSLFIDEGGDSILFVIERWDDNEWGEEEIVDSWEFDSQEEAISFFLEKIGGK